MDHRKTFTVVRLWDPAIDWEAMKRPPIVGYDLREDGSEDEDRPRFAYEPTTELIYSMGRDVDRLVYKPGERPFFFKYQRLTRQQMLSMVARGVTQEEKRVRAFQCGVVEVIAPDGSAWKPRNAKRAGFTTMEEADLDALEREHGIGWTDLQEVGEIVLTRSDLPLGCEPHFVAPPSSVAAWAAESRRSAERSRTAAAPSSSRSGER
jgi:hypothetical protein